MKKAMTDVNIDMSIPFREGFTESPCFGKEWSATDPECRSCGLYDLCCTVYNKTKVKQKREKVKKKETLDSYTFDRLNRKEVYESIIDNPTTYDELIQYIAMESGCSNPALLNGWAKLFFSEYGLKVENTIIVTYES